jgi:PhnB protein
LSVPDAGAALSFYIAALGAVCAYRLGDDGGRPVVARLEVKGAPFWVQEEPDVGDVSNFAKAFRMILTVPDPDASHSRALSAGAIEIAPVSEEYGWRTGRVADPFGYHWELSRPI